LNRHHGTAARSLGLLLVALSISPAIWPQSGTLKGRVIDATSLEPVGNAIVSTDGFRTKTSDDGGFTLELPPGTWNLSFTADGYFEHTLSLEATPDLLREVEIALLAVGSFEENVEVRAVSPKSREPSAEPVGPQEVMRVAGSLDNVFRTVQTLAGVAATEDFGSRLSVRGGEPDQNLTMMDGVEVHNPFRLFGLTSAFNPETVNFFELTAGGFSAKYGDRLSSILIVENRPGTRARKFSGSVAASFTDANLVFEGALPGSTTGSWLFTARRTYYDLVADRITNEDFPSFADLQGKVDLDVGRGTLSLFAMRSRENTNFTFEDDAEPDDFGTIINDAGNDLVSAAYDTTIGERGSSRTVLSWYRNRDGLDLNGQVQNDSKRSNAPDDDGAFGISRIEFDRFLTVEDVTLRQELSFLASDHHFLETGFELHRLDTELKFESSGDRNTSEANGSSIRGGVGLPDFVESALASNRVGAFVQDQIAVGTRWTISPGIRFDWAEANRRATLSPRFQATFQLDPKTRVKGAVGRYTQSPGYEKLIQSDFFIDLTDAAALDLAHQASTHFIVGFARQVTPAISARVEGFYKDYDDLIVGALETDRERLERIASYDFPPELRGSIPTDPIITSRPENDAGGSAYGFDVFVKKEPRAASDKLAGWLSYTFSRAERDAYQRRYAFDYDRRHSLNLVANYRFATKWTLAATARLASGFPYTSPLGLRVAATPSPTDPDRLIPETDSEGRYIYETDLGGTDNLNEARLPFYARVDLRGTWRPGGESGDFEVYFEVINALNRDNAVRIESHLEHDPTSDMPAIRAVPAEGFPLLPSFGIRFRF